MLASVAALLLLLSVLPAEAKTKKSPTPEAKPAAAKAPEPAKNLDVSTAPANAAEVIARFEAIDRQLQGLRARYQQSVTLEQSGVPQSIEGRIEYLKPARLRIEHSKPERQTVVSDGKAIWVYRHSSRQAIQSELADWRKADPMINSLLDFGGYAALAKRYEVSYASATRQVTLTPKEKGAEFVLKLTLSPETFFPAVTELVMSHLTVRTEISELEVNPPLAEADFVFTPPPGADVFRNFKPPRLGP